MSQATFSLIHVIGFIVASNIIQEVRHKGTTATIAANTAKIDEVKK